MSSAVEGLPSIEQVVQNVMASPETPDTGVVSEEAAPAVEAAPEVPNAEVESSAEVPVEKPAEDRFSRQFAALSRKEKELRQKEKESQKRNADYDTKMAAMQAEIESLKSVRETISNAKKTPLKALKDLGLTYQDVTNDVLGQHHEPEPDPLDAKLQPFLSRLEAAELAAKKAEALEQELAKRDEVARQRDIENAERAIKDNFTTAITENEDRYELCNKMGNDALELSRHILQAYWDTHQKVLTYEEVLDITEKHYEDEVLKKLMASKKAKSFAAPDVKSAATTTVTKSATKGASTTLTNAQKGHAETLDVNKMPKEQAIEFLVKKHFNR